MISVLQVYLLSGTCTFRLQLPTVCSLFRFQKSKFKKEAKQKMRYCMYGCVRVEDPESSIIWVLGRWSFFIFLLVSSTLLIFQRSIYTLTFCEYGMLLLLLACFIAIEFSLRWNALLSPFCSNCFFTTFDRIKTKVWFAVRLCSCLADQTFRAQSF